MGKKPIVSVTYENERISIKNSLPYLKCVLCGPRADLWPFYGFLCKRFSGKPLYRQKTVKFTKPGNSCFDFSVICVLLWQGSRQLRRS